MNVSSCDLAALLRRVDLIRHADLGALDHGETIGLEFPRLP
jgi:hypothetical protein